MKKLVILILGIILATAAFSQTQKGYVKTKGRLDNDGNLIPGTPVAEVIIKVKNRNEVMSDKKGNFSFPMPDNIYYLENVSKNGYVLTDPDVLLKQYNYSANKLVISLETKEQQIEERMENFAKINAAQSEMIRNLRNEVKRLKEENKITEEEYSKRLREISDMQVESQKLVEDMVDRYSKIDYDQLNEFDRQISVYILNGELHKADSLLNTKGNLGERAENLKKLNEANAKEREEITKRSKKLEKSEALALKERDDLASDYYHKFEILKMQHKNDSAGYYLEQRTLLDTTNVEWLFETINFMRDIVADINTAMKYSQIALRQSLAENSENSKDIAISYDKLGRLQEIQGQYPEAIDSYQKSIKLKLKLYGENHHEVALGYNNIGVVYFYMGKYDAALEYMQKSLIIRKAILGEEHKVIAESYNNIGAIYDEKGDYNNALEYYQKALNIRLLLLGETDEKVGESYNNIGLVYFAVGNYTEALKNLTKALDIKISVLGDKHPSVADSYNNIGSVYSKLKDKQKSLEYYEKALNLWLLSYGENSPRVALGYNNVGSLLDDNDKALEYLNKSLIIRKSLYGDMHSNVANSYYNIADVLKNNKDYKTAENYYKNAIYIWETVFKKHQFIAIGYNGLGNLYCLQNDYEKALECYHKSLDMYIDVFDKNHPKIQEIQSKISETEAKLKESHKK